MSSYICDFQDPDDWKDTMRVERECFPDDPWSIKGFRSELKAGARCYVLVEEDVVRGAIWFMRDEIISLGVAKAYRGHGFADRLLTMTLSQLHRERTPFVKLDVRPSAVDAMRLYLRHGFKPIAYDKNFYKKNDGAIHMVKGFV